MQTSRITVRGRYYREANTPVNNGLRGVTLARIRRMFVLLPVVVVLSFASVAAAQEPSADAPHYEVPRAWEQLEPALAGEGYVATIFPLSSDPLCPTGADCIFQGGFAFGAALEWRWPKGLAMGIGYDAWFLDGNGVYELGVMHFVRGHIRYLFMHDRLLHPFVGASLGAFVFGDSFGVATAGIGLEGRVGVELELTESIALLVAVPLRAITSLPFQTERDRVERAQDIGVSFASALQIGMTIVDVP